MPARLVRMVALHDVLVAAPMSTRELTGIRPSLWARCPTAAVYQGRGEEEAPLPPETAEWFFRGNVFEEIVVRQIIAKHGKENVERQVIIPIPGIGEGHADAYLKLEKTLVEVKSTVAPFPNSPIFEHGVKQLKLYIHHHPEAEQGVLYMVNPNRMTAADLYTVKLSDEDREQIEFEREEIINGVHLGSGGPKHGTAFRPCTKPAQARGRMCQFANVCFADWEPPDTAEVTDPAALDAAQRLYAIKEELRVHKSAIDALEEGKKDAEGELAELLEVGDSVVGPYAVKRTHVVRQPTFSVRAYEAAGLSLEPLAEFFRPGSEYDLFKVTKAETVGDVDYGDEVPF